MDTGICLIPPPRQARINLRDPAFRIDPHPMLRAMRDSGRVSRDRLGSWLLSHHADVNAALRARHLSREPWRSNLYRQLRPFLADSALERTAEKWIMFSDPPRHTRLRKMLNSSFRPPIVAALLEHIEAVTNDLLGNIQPGSEFDLMERLAKPMPLQLMCSVLGLPTDMARTQPWSDTLATMFEPEKAPEDRFLSNQVVEDMLAYLREHVAQHRSHSRRDTVLGHMVAVQDEDGALSEDELLANLIFIFIAGTETTTNLIGNGMLTLLRHPGELARLREQPELMDGAIDEILRFESPLSLSDRYTIEPYQVGDIVIPKGQLIYLMISSANRDPAVFSDPDRFDIGRKANPHLSFGGGVHYCVGAPLARLEGSVALSQVLKRFPHLALVDAEPDWRPIMNLRGLSTLRVLA